MSVNHTKINASIGYDYVFDEEEGDAPSEESLTDAIMFTGLLGLTNYNTSISDSAPVALTSTRVSAINMTLKASMPVSETMPLTIGGKFELFFNPSLSESPVNSGNASTTMTSFGFFGVYKLTEKYNLRGDFTITNINNRFSGTATRANPAGSGKQELMTEQFGIEYLF